MSGSSVDEFLTASVRGRRRRAVRLLDADPSVGASDISAAAVLGDLAAVRQHLERDPAAATRPDDRRGWPPLSYACHSLWHRVDERHAEGIVGVVSLLLNAGAGPNTDNGRPARQGEDDGTLVDAAEQSSRAVVTLMLDLDFPLDARRADDGATALHAAAYAGRADVVELLLGRGADVRVLDGTWDCTALAWATVGSGERPHYVDDADWPAVVRTLVGAGSPTDDAWIGGKPPSEEVGALLTELGIRSVGGHSDE